MFITISVGRLPLLAYITYYLPSVASEREEIQYHINPHTIVFYNLTCVPPGVPHAVDPAVAEELPADTVAPPGVAHVHSAAWGHGYCLMSADIQRLGLPCSLHWADLWTGVTTRTTDWGPLQTEIWYLIFYHLRSTAVIYLFRKCCIYLVILIFSGSTIVLAEIKVSMLSAFNIDFMAAA